MNQTQSTAGRALGAATRGSILCGALLTLAGAAQGAGVVVEGTNTFQTAVVPSTLSDAVQVSAGRDHVLVLHHDGTVTGYGYNGDGRATPPAGLSGVTAVAAGIYDSLALKGDGTVAAWGYGGAGLTNVPAGLQGVVAVAAGGFHNLALLRGGGVVGWGYNANGRSTAPAGLGGAVAITAGRDHSVALKKDGTVAAWGQNDAGQTNVPAGLSHVTAISAGNAHTLALKSDGTVVAWGSNSQGQTDVPAGLTGVTAVSGGNGYSLALKSDGTVVGWGNNAAGQYTFTQTGLSSVSAGGTESAALGAAGGVRIVQGPSSEVLVAGSGGTLSVVATGPGTLGYQWYFDGAAIAGATQPTLAVGSGGLSGAGVYRVDVSSGSQTVSSGDAVVLVWGTYALTPVGVGGGAATLAVEDTGGAALTPWDLTGWQLQYSTDLLDWVSVTAAGSLVDGQLRIADATAGVPIRFYRLKQ
jgi:hypothetical protein